MMESNKIYITFPKGEALSGWISDFLIHFKSAMHRICNVEIEYLTKEKTFSSDNYQDFIGKSNVFISILGTPTDNEEEYRQELEDIYNSLDIENRKLTELSRLFKICVLPENKMNISESFEKVQSYCFFETKGKRQVKSQTLSFQNNPIKTWSKILDLAYDIKDALELKPEMEALKKESFVYLGSCSEDMSFTRDDIKREIQHFGFRVLPLVSLPENESHLCDVVEENLKHCHHIIQLIGAKYGSIAPSENYSAYELENNCIKKHLELNPVKSSIVWLPNNIRINDSKQNLYINRIKRNDSDLQTEVVETNQEEFKSILAARLISKQAIEVNKNAKKGVYYIGQSNSHKTSILDLAMKEDIPLMNLEIKVGENNYSNHLESLKKADCVLIDYSEADEKWLFSILKDIIKAQGLGKNVPFLAIGVIADEMPQLPEIENWLPKIFHIQIDNMERISEFLSIAKA